MAGPNIGSNPCIGGGAGLYARKRIDLTERPDVQRRQVVLLGDGRPPRPFRRAQRKRRQRRMGHPGAAGGASRIRRMVQKVTSLMLESPQRWRDHQARQRIGSVHCAQ